MTRIPSGRLPRFVPRLLPPLRLQLLSPLPLRARLSPCFYYPKHLQKRREPRKFTKPRPSKPPRPSPSCPSPAPRRLSSSPRGSTRSSTPIRPPICLLSSSPPPKANSSRTPRHSPSPSCAPTPPSPPPSSPSTHPPRPPSRLLCLDRARPIL